MATSSDDDVLNGWKDIAAYVGKSVRTAQRWELHFGLPTHRLKTPDGQVVYARRSEIEAWRAALDPDTRRATTDADAPDADTESAEISEPVRAPEPPADPVPAAAPLPARATPLWRHSVVTTAALVVAVGALVWWWSWRTGTSRAFGPTPLTLALVDKELHAFDGRGNLLWTHRFTTKVSKPNESLGRSVDGNDAHVARVDLDGDGTLDNIVAVSPGSSPEEAQGLIAISDTGRVLWQVTGDQTLRCGGRNYHAPWVVTSVVLRGDPVPEVWVAFSHHTWWPSYVVQVHRDGRQEVRYVQSGWIKALTDWSTPTQSLMAAGGVLNEYKEASVVLFDPTAPLTMLRGTNPTFACEVDGTAPPARAVLFPNLEVPQAQGIEYVLVKHLKPRASELFVDMYTGTNAITAQLAGDGSVEEFAVTDSYWFQHRDLERANVLRHPAFTCPDRARMQTIRMWTPGTGWASLPIKLRSN